MATDDGSTERRTETTSIENSSYPRASSFPWLIPSVVVANVVVFVVVMFINNCPRRSNSRFRFEEEECVVASLGRFSFEPLYHNHLYGPSFATLFTCVWLHAGVFHLAPTMMSLVIVGIPLEQHFRFVRVGAVYMLSGFAGSILSALFVRNKISVGASGALFGLCGAELAELATNWSIHTNRFSALERVYILPCNLFIGILLHLDLFSHIGGFLSGFLLGFVLLPRPQLENRNLDASLGVEHKYKLHQNVLGLVSLVLLFVGYIVGIVMLFRGVNGSEHCHWCHYLICVPYWKISCRAAKGV